MWADWPRVGAVLSLALLPCWPAAGATSVAHFIRDMRLTGVDAEAQVLKELLA